MPSLILIKSPGGLVSGQAFPLAADNIVIGREDGCEIVIPNNSVSRRHAQILRRQGTFVVEDLKSRNRTFVNNKEVAAPVALRNDDRIKICDYLFRFHDERTAVPAPLPREFNRSGPPSGDDADSSAEQTVTTVQHTVHRGSAQQFLDAQPSERLRALLDISVSLSRVLELDALLPQVADTLFGVFRQADRCFIILLDEAGRPVPKAVKNRRSSSGEDRFSKTIVRKCLESMESYLSEDASSDSNLGAAQSIAEFRIRSVMCVPLASADGKPLGALQLDTQDFGKKFREDDLKLLTTVANLASVAIEKADAMTALVSREKQQQEIEIAKKVQLGFLPQTVPQIPGYEFFAFYSAAQTIGGDYYDFIALPGGRLAVVLGDVAGKGVPAALLMAKLSAEARFCLLTQPNAADAVGLLNDQLIRGGIGDRFVTLAVLVLDPAANAVTIVNAGHINPQRYAFATAALTDAVTDAEAGIPLGLVAGFEYCAKVVTLAPGEALLAYTDGVTDAMSPVGSMFGCDGVVRALGPDGRDYPPRPAVAGERLVRGVRVHAAGRPQNDDIAVVCFGRVEAPDGPRTGQRIVPDPPSGVLSPNEPPSGLLSAND